MSQIVQIFSTIFGRNLRLLQPKQLCCQRMIKYSEKIYEAGKVNENVNFLKLQREQLKELRMKIIKERDLIKDKIAQLDEKIKNIKQKDSEKNTIDDSNKSD